MADFLACCGKKHRVTETYRLQEYKGWDWYFVQQAVCSVCNARQFGVFKLDAAFKRHPAEGADQARHKDFKQELKTLIDGRIAELCPDTPSYDKSPTRGESHACEWSRRARDESYVRYWLRCLRAPFHSDEVRGGRGANYG